MNRQAFILVAALFGAGAVASQTADLLPGSEPGPVAYSGHGVVFTQDGREIDASPDFIRAAQAYYVSQVHASATPQQRANYELKANYLAEVIRADERASLAARAQLLDWYIAEVQPVDGKALARKSRIVAGAGILRGYTMSLSTAALVSLVGLSQPLPQPADLAADRVAYIKKCRDAGVPVPASYQLSGNGWTDNGELTPLFIGPGDQAKVAYSTSATPKGVCIALPRFKTGETNTVALGLICMGSTTSKACFFDDKTGPALDAVRPLTEFKSNAELVGGDVCTDCHAGENSFIIHPDAAAFKGLDRTMPDNWYSPMVSATWPQNPGPGTIKGQCSKSCHAKDDAGRFPTVSTALPGYCGTVLPSAVAQTMDFRASPKWLAYSDQIKALLDACKKAPSP